jgi:uncharacterized protein
VYYFLEVNKMKKDIAYMITLVLLVVGGVNWGLVGLLRFDLVEFLLGSIPLLQSLVYILVGLSAGYVALRNVSH